MANICVLHLKGLGSVLTAANNIQRVRWGMSVQ